MADSRAGGRLEVELAAAVKAAGEAAAAQKAAVDQLEEQKRLARNSENGPFIGWLFWSIAPIGCGRASHWLHC